MSAFASLLLLGTLLTLTGGLIVDRIRSHPKPAEPNGVDQLADDVRWALLSERTDPRELAHLVLWDRQIRGLDTYVYDQEADQ